VKLGLAWPPAPIRNCWGSGAGRSVRCP
jgi:hypothetical protein